MVRVVDSATTIEVKDVVASEAVLPREAWI
jgi:hypothetical protein